MKCPRIILSCLISTLLVATASATWETVTDPVPLKSLQGSFFLDVGDNRFSDFDLDIIIVNGDPFITDPNNMKVQGVKDGEGNYGLRFNGFLWYAGANQVINVNLGFKVSVLSDANYINGVSLLLTGANVTGDGTVDASEIVWDDFPGGEEIALPKCWYYADDTQLSDSQEFEPLKEIYVETKNISLIGLSGSAQFYNFFQFYSQTQVPEPATIILLGTAGIWILTRKNKFVRPT